jgi:hypothetical protein
VCDEICVLLFTCALLVVVVVVVANAIGIADAAWMDSSSINLTLLLQYLLASPVQVNPAWIQ